MRTKATSVALLLLTVTACGTRADREAYLRTLADRNAIVDGGTAVDVPGAAGSTDPTDPGTASTSGTTATTGTKPAAATAAPKTTTAAAGRPGSVSTDVIGKTIRIGMHVPITGAAPLPTDFETTVDVIERYLNDNPVHGRGVELLVEDDGYDPAKGQAACRKLAGADIAFAVGHTMPAVQDGCAALFGERGIPYLMRGTYEGVLRDRPLAYFGTISDERQGRLLADYALNRLSGRSKKLAVVFQNDQTAAKGSFVARLQDAGAPVVVAEESVPRQSDYGATVQKLQQAGAQIVFLSMPPVDAIKISVQSQGQGYHPQWLGGATYWNYNMTLESAGMALDGAVAFSPWPTIDSPGAESFKETFRRYRPSDEPQDIGLIMWGWAGLFRTAIESAGPQLSRASFLDALDALRFDAPYWQPIAYTAADHRGAQAVAVFRADGQAKRWRQISGFASGF